MLKNQNIFPKNDYSPESTVKRNLQGKDVSKLKHTWKAKWITHPSSSTLDYGVFLFRRSFDLEKIPAEFIVFVSADNRYRLFVNGISVCFGPALGDLEHYRYETIDLAPYMKNGRNVIAVEVVNFGEFRRGAQLSFQTAFILQNDAIYGININTGENGWKVIQNMAYQDIPFLPEDLNAYYCAGPGDRLDGNVYPWGWEKVDFDDNTWLIPRAATVEFAVGRGFLYGSTWFLVPRKIPFMEEIPQRFKNIVRAVGIEVSDSFLEGKNPIIIHSNTIVSVLFDQGVHTVAFPELRLSSGKGSKIKITYAEALFKKLSNDENNSDGHMDKIDRKGNRNETEGKEIFGVYDIFYPDGELNRLFRPLWKRTFRFVQLDIETGSEYLILNDFSSIFTGYPFKEKAQFNSDDPEIDKIWKVAWRTLRNGACEIFQDTPYYEQLQYIGDTRLSSLVSIYVSGDDRLMRKAIEQFDDSRIPEGLTQSRYPACIKQIITPFSLYWVGMLHDYYMYRNDPEFIKRFLPGIRSVLEWFEKRIDKRGMLTNLEWWSFTDWVSAFPNGIPPGADDGYSANIAMQYIYSLNNAVDIFKYFGWQVEADKFDALAKNMKKAVYDLCFDQSKGLFAETPEKKMFTQHTNIMAILSDTLDEKIRHNVMHKILDDENIVEATLFFKFYLFRALQKTGMGDEYLNQLTPWKKMLANGLTTFAESDHNPRSDCHSWSATPCFDLLHIVAGIYPSEPGFSRITIEPNFGDLNHIKAQIPHPDGELIKVDLIKFGDGGIKGTVSLPKGCRGSFVWNNVSFNLETGSQNIFIQN